MKKSTVSALAAAMTAFGFVPGCSAAEPVEANAEPPQKVLIVCYSWSGNTLEIARQIKELTGAELVELKPAQPYPANYRECVDQAKREINANFKPELKTKIENLKDFDMVFIGSPNWWSTIAPPVAAFLSANDLSGKTVVPFITHGGGSIGRCESTIRELCPKSKVLKSLYLPGGSVKRAKPEVEKFLKANRIIE